MRIRRAENGESTVQEAVFEDIPPDLAHGVAPRQETPGQAQGVTEAGASSSDGVFSSRFLGSAPMFTHIPVGGHDFLRVQEELSFQNMNRTWSCQGMNDVLDSSSQASHCCPGPQDLGAGRTRPAVPWVPRC